MGNWRPTTLKDLQNILAQDLEECDGEQREAFGRYRVVPSLFPIVRYGESEQVFVVARRSNEVIYWEDGEGGFNISPLDATGGIAQHWCNQDSLGTALNEWIEGRQSGTRLCPAEPLND